MMSLCLRRGRNELIVGKMKLRLRKGKSLGVAGLGAGQVALLIIQSDIFPFVSLLPCVWKRPRLTPFSAIKLGILLPLISL
jgi:hypothetical protein